MSTPTSPPACTLIAPGHPKVTALGTHGTAERMYRHAEYGTRTCSRAKRVCVQHVHTQRGVCAQSTAAYAHMHVDMHAHPCMDSMAGT